MSLVTQQLKDDAALVNGIEYKGFSRSPFAITGRSWSRRIFWIVLIGLGVYGQYLRDQPLFIVNRIVTWGLVLIAFGALWTYRRARTPVLTVFDDRLELKRGRQTRSIAYDEIGTIEEFHYQDEHALVVVANRPNSKKAVLVDLPHLSNIKNFLLVKASSADVTSHKRALRLVDDKRYVACFLVMIAVLWFVLSIPFTAIINIAFLIHCTLQFPLGILSESRFTKGVQRVLAVIVFALFGITTGNLLVNESEQFASVLDICANVPRVVFQSGCIEELHHRDSEYLIVGGNPVRVDVRSQIARVLTDEEDGIFIRPQSDETGAWRNPNEDIRGVHYTEQLMFSADGETVYQLARLSDTQITHYSLSTGQLLNQWAVSDSRYGATLGLSPDERFVYAANVVIDTETDEQVQLDAYLDKVVAGPDGTFFYINDDRQLEVWSLPSRAVQTLPIEQPRAVFDFVFNHRQTHIALCPSANELLLYDLASGVLLQEFSSVDDCAITFFSDDSHFMLCHRSGGSGRALRVYDATAFAQVKEINNGPCNTTISADHTQIAIFSEQQVVVWNIEDTPAATHIFMLNDDRESSGTFSADGTRLAVQRWGGTAIFDLSR